MAVSLNAWNVAAIDQKLDRFSVCPSTLSDKDLWNFYEDAQKPSCFCESTDAFFNSVGPHERSKLFPAGISTNSALTLLLDLTKSSMEFKAKMELTKRSNLRGISMETFKDISLNPELYSNCCNTFWANTDFGSSVSESDHHYSQCTSRSLDSPYSKLIPVNATSRRASQNEPESPIHSENKIKTNELTSSFEDWMTELDRMTLKQHDLDEEKKRLIEVLDGLYPNSKTRSKKKLVAQFIADMASFKLKNARQNDAMSMMLQHLDNMVRPREKRGGTKLRQSQAKPKLSKSKRRAIRKRRGQSRCN